MFLKNQSEADFNWADPGRYPIRILKAEATVSQNENRSPMLKLQSAIEGGEFDGVTIFDNIITQEGKPGAGFGKRKLRGLGVNVDSEVPIEDTQIAEQLVGQLVFADLDVEERKKKDEASGLYLPQTTIGADGKQIVVMTNKVSNYYLHGVTGATTQAPQAQAPQATRAPAPATQTPMQPPTARLPIQDVSTPPQGGYQAYSQPTYPPGGLPPPGNGYAQFPQGAAPWQQPAAPQEAQAQAGASAPARRRSSR